ncbi:hypothetical protein Q0Z83_044530 [Actinoplanes sichuanensis]|uniref:Uncharacterized protein n=1 Tax=Actinoplanes sichuanensis TaxID=512349 RepID=A0ABW4AMD0_9ACTN|nr:hypothetical protein [Actinoplanes sichuanensis]BEL06262.1 hypothetical protein Q0Z83_044530 [Actinoplanes sichuanensis]
MPGKTESNRFESAASISEMAAIDAAADNADLPSGFYTLICDSSVMEHLPKTSQPKYPKCEHGYSRKHWKLVSNVSDPHGGPDGTVDA